MGLLVKKTKLYAERCEEKRRNYLATIDPFDAKNFLFLDESGMDEYLEREYARTFQGNQVISDVSGRKHGRVSMIAAWSPASKKMLAPFVFRGHTDTKLFNEWLEKCLLPELRPGQIIIMDNASFHKSARTKELIKSAGCSLIFLPPYSPDFNPIEQQWAVIKAKFRKYKHLFESFDDAVNYAFTV